MENIETDKSSLGNIKNVEENQFNFVTK
jgi:hypothetical protein